MLSAVAAASTVSVQSEPPVRVVRVFVAGSQWAQGAKDWLASVGSGDARYGLWASSGGGPYGTFILPWTNLDQVTVLFDGDVLVDAGDLTVRGTGRSYPAGSVDYHMDWARGLGVATWTLAQPLRRDRFTIEVNGDPPDGVRGPGGFLDGDHDLVPGGDYRVSIDVLLGDVGGNGDVTALDVAAVKRVLGRSYGDGHTGVGSYDTWADVNADGRINALDVAAVKRNLGTPLPPASSR
jgi:hypothetical protein